MNKLDMIILVVLAAAFIFGYRRGFVLQLVSLLGMFVAWLTAYLFYDDIAPYVSRILPVEKFTSYDGYGGELLKSLRIEHYIIAALSFAIVLTGVKVVLTVAGHVLNVLAKVPGLNMMNRWSGGLLGLLEGAVAVVVAVHIMAILPNDAVQGWLVGSHAAEWSMEWVPTLFGKIKELPSTVV